MVREEIKSGRLVGAAEASKERAEWRRLQRKNLSILGLPKGKSGLSATERAVGKYAGAAFSKKRRKRAICPNHQIMRGRESRWARESRIIAGAWRGKGGLHSEGRQIPRRAGWASNKSLPRTSRRKHERVSGRKGSPGRSAESWPHSKSGQT